MNEGNETVFFMCDKERAKRDRAKVCVCVCVCEYVCVREREYVCVRERERKNDLVVESEGAFHHFRVHFPLSGGP